jgi:hypothetical protein
MSVCSCAAVSADSDLQVPFSCYYVTPDVAVRFFVMLCYLEVSDSNKRYEIVSSISLLLREMNLLLPLLEVDWLQRILTLTSIKELFMTYTFLDPFQEPG